MQKNCRQCQIIFEIASEDLKFYDKISPVFNGEKYLIPPPTLCPVCRQQRRLAFRNERKLYHRKCDLTGKEFISAYSPDQPYKVYEPSEWWSDRWDPLSYGRNFDFTRPFFEQFKALWQTVPMLGLSEIGNENCGYVNYCGYSKHCYLCYNTDFSEEMLYSTNCIKCKNSGDLLNSMGSELCYNSTDLYSCYNVHYSSFSFNCSDSAFLNDCRNCSYCFGCTGLRNKKYYFFNQACSEKEYFEKIKELDLGSAQVVEKVKIRAHEVYLKIPKLYLTGKSFENSSGNYIFQSANIVQSYDIEKCENIKYSSMLNTTNNCYDWDYTGYNSSFCYELSSCGDRLNQSCFSHNIWSGGLSLFYCVLGSRLENCLGCVGLKNKKYCILNKQYTKDEYETLMPMIIEHMSNTSEWGEFFPMSLSPFGYDETLANEYTPLTQKQAADRGINWKKENTLNRYQGPTIEVPENIHKVSDEITKQILTCGTCAKNYKIIRQELDFHRKIGINLPINCPDCRHKIRLALRNPHKLYDRTCIKCNATIQTTYAPDHPEIVYCEQCYLKEMY